MSPPQPASADPLVVLDGVCKDYAMGTRRIRALDGVGFSLGRGAFWAVMGPSGSGKSTLLNLLGCLDRPSAGSYRLDGVDVGSLGDDALSELRLSKLGFVFQSFNLIPQLTVLENIELPLFYQGRDRAGSSARAAELAALMGLGERLHHRPSELSGGQQQRVAIARALANAPAVLLADEPTGNLDSATGGQIMGILSGLNREGMTIIMVTHEPQIATYARTQLHMLDGRIDRIEGEGR